MFAVDMVKPKVRVAGLSTEDAILVDAYSESVIPDIDVVIWERGETVSAGMQ